MEDTLDICAGCGKMPRAMDRLQGSFVCSRCNGVSILSVKADEYERTAQELDQRFHSNAQKQRIEAAASHPVEMKPRGARSGAKKAAKPKAAPRKSPSKKAAKARKR